MFVLTFILTILLVIPTPYGYLNVSDSLLMSVAKTERKVLVLFSMIIAITCADIYLGYINYAIFTFVIRSIQVFVLVFINEKISLKYNTVLSFMIAAIIMLIGYGLADVILFKSLSYFWVSILTNLSQAVLSLIIGLFLINFKSLLKVYR